MKRCIGKLESGKRCSIVPLGDQEMCKSCVKRGAEVWQKAEAVKPFRAKDLKLGKPARKGEKSEAQAELEAALPILCRSCAGNGICEGSGLGVTHCAAYCPEVEVPTEAQGAAAQKTVISDNSAAARENRTAELFDNSEQLGSATAIPVAEQNQKVTAKADTAELSADDHAGESLEEEDLAAAYSAPSSDHSEDIGMGPDCMRATEVQIPSAAPTPPLQPVDPCLKPSSPLAALLVELPAPAPPLPDTSVVLDFPPDMLSSLVDQEVGTETILELLYVLFVSKEYRLVRHEAA